MARLEGKVALITGGASGIGMEVAKAYIAEGAQVAIMGLADDKLDAATASLGGDTISIAGDVRNYADNERAVAETVEAFGGLDIFVANAGVWDWGTRMVDMTPDQLEATYDEVLGTNLKGYMLGAKAAAVALAKRKGCMIFTLSTASVNSAGGGIVYTASKHAGLGVMRQLAYELAPHVRVNGVAVGAALTDLRGPSSLGLEGKSIKELPLKEAAPMFLPMGEQPEPSAFTAPYVLLAADGENASMTGTAIDCMCGYNIRGATGPNGWGDFDPAAS
ncbi:SDR family NAD(P)-dependent oxidoreductase [Aurantiacibacter sediminis]|nr:SDR family NAD(P)-dependent oxidoreductase [Aurantiacibacter sediminis]